MGHLHHIVGDIRVAGTPNSLYHHDQLQHVGQPYGPDTIEMMASWRATEGHSFANRDANTDDTLVGELCSKTLWRYEQGEYDTLDSYINGGVPGVMLGFLALVIWVMPIFKDHRNLNEQFVALWLLLKTGWGMHPARVAEDGTVTVLAISSLERWALSLGVYLPRLLIMINPFFESLGMPRAPIIPLSESLRQGSLSIPRDSNKG
ncbi:unnamed protein product [Polarella glacialis]|uniref:Uncharacterized protein n=1 Tax=Polarella glacialis TaxID=89957 RepID=A0A813HDN1_POLGL|nr:unnamed protein product [Polarella glacialis]